MPNAVKSAILAFSLRIVNFLCFAWFSVIALMIIAFINAGLKLDPFFDWLFTITLIVFVNLYLKVFSNDL